MLTDNKDCLHRMTDDLRPDIPVDLKRSSSNKIFPLQRKLLPFLFQTDIRWPLVIF